MAPDGIDGDLPRQLTGLGVAEVQPPGEGSSNLECAGLLRLDVAQDAASGPDEGWIGRRAGIGVHGGIGPAVPQSSLDQGLAGVSWRVLRAVSAGGKAPDERGQ